MMMETSTRSNLTDDEKFLMMMMRKIIILMRVSLTMRNWRSLKSHLHACGTAKHTDCNAGEGARDMGGP